MLVLAAFAVTVAIGIIRGGAGRADEVAAPATSASPFAPAQPDVLYVHVAGAVARPGLYALPGGSRVVDAIAAAGGIADGGDQAAVNLAREVSDGEQIVVPMVGEAPPAATGSGGASGAAGDDAGVVDLNTADAAALDSLPRIGPALAERILAWRDENGRFASVEDLLAVPGIGEKLLEGLRDRVRV